MSESTNASITPGRPVRLVPTPPGFWMTLLGAALAAIAPLFGFLGGSMVIGTDRAGTMSPLYWGLFIGVVIGAFGVLIALLGARRLWRHLHPRETTADTAGARAAGRAES